MGREALVANGAGRDSTRRPGASPAPVDPAADVPVLMRVPDIGAGRNLACDASEHVPTSDDSAQISHETKQSNPSQAERSCEPTTASKRRRPAFKLARPPRLRVPPWVTLAALAGLAAWLLSLSLIGGDEEAALVTTPLEDGPPTVWTVDEDRSADEAPERSGTDGDAPIDSAYARKPNHEAQAEIAAAASTNNIDRSKAVMKKQSPEKSPGAEQLAKKSPKDPNAKDAAENTQDSQAASGGRQAPGDMPDDVAADNVTQKSGPSTSEAPDGKAAATGDLNTNSRDAAPLPHGIVRLPPVERPPPRDEPIRTARTARTARTTGEPPAVEFKGGIVRPDPEAADGRY